jgi:hypothetical protein
MSKTFFQEVIVPQFDSKLQEKVGIDHTDPFFGFSSIQPVYTPSCGDKSWHSISTRPCRRNSNR